MTNIKKSKVIVTGGCGFIGSHLVKELVMQGSRIMVVDIAIHPKSMFALDKLRREVELRFTDVRDKKKIFAIVRRYDPDYIIHLAAEPIVSYIVKNPYDAFHTNIMGTIHILEVARKLKSVKGVIVASSDKAYGKTRDTYTEDSPLRADHPYDVSKASIDLISQAYSVTYQVPVVVTRFGNVYGEGDFHFDRIIPGLCKALIRKKELLLRSDGSYVRDYLYVNDVVSGYIFLLKNIKRANGHAFNFASKDNISVLELIRKAEKVLNIKIKYKILNTAHNEIPYQHLNDEKVRKLGWKSQYTLRNSLPNVYTWYQKLLQI